MNSDQSYRVWRDQKKQIEVRPDFEKKLMNRVHQYERGKRQPLFDVQQLLEFISVHPLAKAGLIAAGAIAGVVRLVFMIIVILNKGVING